MLKFWRTFLILVKFGLSSGFTEYGVSLFAGTPKVNSYSGDGGYATSAKFGQIRGLWISSSDEVFISDYGNSRIRKVQTDGIVVAYAGATTSGTGGDGSAATSVLLSKNWGICGDSVGNLYVVESTSYVVRRIDSFGGIYLLAGSAGLQTNTATTPPGINPIGDNGPAEYATFRTPSGVFAASGGDIYIADKNNCRIRKVSGILITTYAGSGGKGLACPSNSGGDGGPATSASFKGSSSSVWQDTAGNTFIGEDLGYKVRRVDALTQKISTVAGNGLSGFIVDGVQATSTRILGNPINLWGSSSGTSVFLYIGAQNMVRVVDLVSGILQTLAGNSSTTGAYTGDGGPAANAYFNTINQVASYTTVDRLMIADGVNCAVRLLVALSASPTALPTTIAPSVSPSTIAPSTSPSIAPSQPTLAPHFDPTFSPSGAPSNPTFAPSDTPVPTVTPVPSMTPTDAPSATPTLVPTAPTELPTKRPSWLPTERPSFSQQPTLRPTLLPTMRPSDEPSEEPTPDPSFNPTVEPTPRPSNPSYRPSGQPNPVPSRRPTFIPTLYPTQPTVVPTLLPSPLPTTTKPTVVPTTTQPSQPTPLPTTIAPSNTRMPTTIKPSMRPTRYMPTFRPTFVPTATGKPSYSPSRRWEEIVFTSVLCIGNLNTQVTVLTKVDKSTICHTAAQIMSIPANNVTVLSEKLTAGDAFNTICADVQTYAQTREFSWVVDSNATQLYEALAYTMNKAVAKQNFTSILQNVSASLGSANLLTADATSVTVQAYSYYVFVPVTDDDYLTDSQVAGVSLGGVLLAFCVVAFTLAVCSVMDEKGF